MKIVGHSIEMIYPLNREGWVKAAKYIESSARTCYKSEDRITDDSWIKMIKMLKDKDHSAMLEFGSAMVKVTTDRGVTHEIVRHRIASYAQESTRYCNYSNDKFGNEITVICPINLFDDTKEAKLGFSTWKVAMEDAEKYYFLMLKEGTSPQIARSVLPNSLKTEINIKMNFREWLHFFKLRTAPAAHPDMQYVAKLIQEEFQKGLPELFV